ncbi:hypothetical protein BK675_04295 [Pseudomonas fluorescens]|nr:hypothetical protein BK677_03690 [Pseudomonas fluorescens]ROO11898.1 hypothetical protein BK675_04295 [Pseudomonas fluorescens]ROO20209.1 hypothetical protein BK676_06325 [Pseudomonas fluorescens]
MDVLLQPENHLPAEGELISEGEIILSSVCCEFGASCISHAGGTGGGWHRSTVGTGGADMQPASAIVNSAAQAIVFGACISQFLSVSLVNRVPFGQHLAADSGRFT